MKLKLILALISFLVSTGTYCQIERLWETNLPVGGDSLGIPPEISVPLCPVNNISFTQQLGFGTTNKILIRGSSTNDGTICWNYYSDAVKIRQSRFDAKFIY